MNTKELASAVRSLKSAVNDGISETCDPIVRDSDDFRDAKDLLGVLANIIEGKQIEKAFGSPGDWGHDTPIGRALAARS